MAVESANCRIRGLLIPGLDMSCHPGHTMPLRIVRYGRIPEIRYGGINYRPTDR